jgi:putative ABC transport system ATP-binding protein
VIRLFSGLVSSGKTVIIVTHERDVTTFVDRAIVLSDGSIERELKGARSQNTYDAREAAHA